MEGHLLHDRYRIQKSLGRTTLKSGQRTYLAIDETTNQPVVIKVLRFGAEFEWEQL